jgi:serine/threonine protein kinase/Tol biopolymer transport system component
MELSKKQKQRVESVFHEALNLAPELRQEYVARVCSDDESVRRETLSLLRHYDSAGPLLNLGSPTAHIPVSIGHYEVIGQLGQGGMGSVYLAFDTGLNRKVAIKVVSPSFADAPGALERLRGEALALSKLNHRNILIVHDLDSDNGSLYIVSEYIEGQSLRELIGTLTPAMALKYARQIGEALSEAHKFGVVHRDVKPENVIVRPNGEVKVLDFGLAKLIELPAQTEDQVDWKASHSQATQPGVLMGTLNYMSPEQANPERGPVDFRTDIWSWGIVLYEMLAGRRPFEASDIDKLRAAHQHTPKPAIRHRRLNRIISRTIKLEPAQRYSSMQEALQELPREIGQVSRYARQLIRSFAPVNGQMQWKPWAGAVALLLLLVLGVARFVSWELNRNYQIISSENLKTTGQINVLACSPDGAYIVYATGEFGGEALRVVRTLHNYDDVPLIPPRRTDYAGITVSEDGLIYYVTRENELGKAYQISLFGGESKFVADHVDSSVTLSPDGTQIAFFREDPSANATLLIIHYLKSGEDKAIRSVRWPDVYLQSPLWSLDSNDILTMTFPQNDPLQGSTVRIEQLRADSGAITQSVVKRWRWASNLAWLNHGRAIAVAAAGIGSGRTQMTQVKWPSGNESALKRDGDDYRDVSTSMDSKTITALQVGRRSQIWLAPIEGTEPARSVTTVGKYYGISWIPTGQLLTFSEQNGHFGLWVIDPDSHTEHALLTGAFAYQEAVSTPDGRHIVYVSDRDGTLHLWRANIDASHAVRLTSTPFRETSPAITPDGKWVVYTSAEKGFSLRKVSIDGGASTTITDHDSRRAAISSDEKWIVCQYYVDAEQGWRWAILNFDTGKPIKVFADIPAGDADLPVCWTRDGKLMYSATDKSHVSNIWVRQIDDGPGQQLTHFSDDTIFAFAPSFDGKRLALVRGKASTDIVLMHTGN